MTGRRYPPALSITPSSSISCIDSLCRQLILTMSLCGEASCPWRPFYRCPQRGQGTKGTDRCRRGQHGLLDRVPSFEDNTAAMHHPTLAPFWGRWLGNGLEGPWPDKPPGVIPRVSVPPRTPRRATLSSHSRRLEGTARMSPQLPALSSPQTMGLALWRGGMGLARSLAWTAGTAGLARWGRRPEPTVRHQGREWCEEAAAKRGAPPALGASPRWPPSRHMSAPAGAGPGAPWPMPRALTVRRWTCRQPSAGHAASNARRACAWSGPFAGAGP